MPGDTRRINGPEVSIPYSIYCNKNKEINLNDSYTRKDNRKNDEIRKFFVRTGIVTQAKGSAYIEMGDTKVICSVFDPREIPNQTSYSMKGEIYCEFKYATFSCPKRTTHQQDSEEKEYSLILKRVLEPAVCLHEFPNFQVDVYATVLDNDGSALAAAIMAASLALASASVPMYGLVTASTMGIYNDLLLLDPTDKEEAVCILGSNSSRDTKNHGFIMLASLFPQNQICEIYQVGNMDVKCIKNVTKKLMDINEKIYPVPQECLLKLIKKKTINE